MPNAVRKMPLFLGKIAEVMDLRRAMAVLQWDQEVCMPPKGAEARGHQLATLAALEHRLFTAPEMVDLVEALAADADVLMPDERAMVLETAHDQRRAMRLPEKLVQRFAEAQSRAYQAWVTARKESQ
ncbi:MAG: carboxypeptidase M32, partial [Candidatus Hydrogenedens sp.]|nr:carboxypeptidase M32 [Candidatus Hydrogenedens sp.]